LDALLELDHTDLRGLVDGDGGDVEDIGDAGETVCGVILVEGVEDLDTHGTRGYVLHRAIFEIHPRCKVGVGV
jgi:hypothetical protein